MSINHYKDLGYSISSRFWSAVELQFEMTVVMSPARCRPSRPCTVEPRMTRIRTATDNTENTEEIRVVRVIRGKAFSVVIRGKAFSTLSVARAFAVIRGPRAVVRRPHEAAKHRAVAALHSVRKTRIGQHPEDGALVVVNEPAMRMQQR